MKNIYILIIAILLVSHNLFAATLCTDIQEGGATHSGSQAAYSNCTMNFQGIGEFYIGIKENMGNLVVFFDSVASEFNPSPGSVLMTGGNTDGLSGVLDKGIGYTGICPDVSSADIASVSLITNHVYCVIIEASSGPNMWFKSTWNGSQFTDTVIAYDLNALPVELIKFSVE
ncbi:MAG: hypothetical protein AB8B80_03260 [Marinicellaceae bacterium]